MVAESDSASQALTKAPRDRSPAYPFISLKAAVERLGAFDAKFGRRPTPADKAGLAWGMKEKSSQAFQTLATLKSFGLVEYKGANTDRVVLLTDDGRNYLRAQQPEVKAAILKSSALRPKAIAVYWQQWGADRPIDPICIDQLVLKDGFTQSAAITFLRVYDETVAFARLANGDTMHSIDEAQDEGPMEAVYMQQATVPMTAAGFARAGVQPVATVTSSLPPVAGSHDDKYELGDGRAFVLRWPATVNAAEFEEFEAWIALLQKKLKRSVQE